MWLAKWVFIIFAIFMLAVWIGSIFGVELFEGRFSPFTKIG